MIKRELTGRTAIVTGSTSGIGVGIARALAAAGADIMINGFGETQEIDEILRDLERDHAVSVIYSSADMSKPDEIRTMVAQAMEKFGRVDILVNNAGIQFTAPVADFSTDCWDGILAVNLSAAFHAIQAALPHMLARDWGRIINIASVHGLVASPEKAAYVAAKHGLIGLSKVVALETAATGVTSNAICPGWVLTPLVQHQIDQRARGMGISQDQATRELLAAKQPSAEFVTPEQIGALTVFLCSAAASQMRGGAVPIDGGWTAQ